MKNYIKNLFSFSIFVFTLWGAFSILNINIYRLDLDKHRSSMILGDSHGVHGINPELLSSNSVSYCMPAEPLSITYFKLKNIQKETNIDTLFLVVGPHSFSNIQDFTLIDIESTFIERYAQIVVSEDLEMPLDTISAFKCLVKEIALKPNFLFKKHMGDFDALESHSVINENNIKSRVNLHFYRDSSKGDVSLTQLKYYNKIHSFCKQKNILLFTVATPVHSKYLAEIPDVFMSSYDSIMDTHVCRSAVDGLRLLYHDSLFYDADHLNVRGSEVFTTYLKEKIKPPNISSGRSSLKDLAFAEQ